MKVCIKLAVGGDHLFPGQVAYLETDERGESETYEAYSLRCVDAGGSQVWTEGLRKDRSAMWPAWREAVEPALAHAKGCAP